MKIVVCVSHVPDSAAKINIGADEKNIDQNGVSFILNPYDEFALEEALKIKDSIGADVVLVSVGGDEVKETIRKGLAMGADSGILLKTNAFRDSISTAKLIAEEIKLQEANLVFLGKQSIDGDNGIVGQLVAEILGFNSVSVAVSFNLNGNKIVAEREIEGGREVVETSLPAVITAQKGLNDPRYASLKGIMAAKKKVIDEKEVTVSEIGVELIRLKKPAQKQAGKILGKDSSAIPELVRLLKEEAKVI